MKLQRIFMLGCMVVAMGLIASCSGEDGEDGAVGPVGPASTVPGPVGPASTVPGPTGAAGDDGINCWDLDSDGINDPEEDINGDEVFDALDCQGADGADGQGTTAERIIVVTSGLDVDLNPVTLEVAELTQEVLDTHAILAYISDGTTYFAIPGYISDSVTIYGGYSIHYNAGEVILIDELDNGWRPSIYQEVHIILIPTTTLGAKSQDDVMSSLKDKGVDTNDYKEVVRYFGLNQ